MEEKEKTAEKIETSKEKTKRGIPIGKKEIKSILFGIGKILGYISIVTGIILMILIFTTLIKNSGLVQ